MECWENHIEANYVGILQTNELRLTSRTANSNAVEFQFFCTLVSGNECKRKRWKENEREPERTKTHGDLTLRTAEGWIIQIKNIKKNYIVDAVLLSYVFRTNMYKWIQEWNQIVCFFVVAIVFRMLSIYISKREIFSINCSVVLIAQHVHPIRSKQTCLRSLVFGSRIEYVWRG